MQMMWSIILFAILACAAPEFSTYSSRAAQQHTKVDPKLFMKAEKKGSVIAIVGLDVDKHLDQRHVEKLKDDLLTQLSRTTHKVQRRLENMSYIALSVGPHALAVLESSDLVRTVRISAVGTLP